MPSDLLIGGAASEGAVRGLLPNARVVHFGTHAVVTESDPLGSHLALGGAREPRPVHPAAPPVIISVIVLRKNELQSGGAA